MAKKKMIQFSIRLPHADHAWLTALAERDETSLALLVAQAVADWRKRREARDNKKEQHT